MAMIVKHNMLAINSNRMLGVNTQTQSKITEKLSSGYKINRAADDAAGLAISEKMRRQVRGLTQSSLNAQDGISMVQTAEGALNEVHDMLQRLSELSVKAGTGTLTTKDRSFVDTEVQQLLSEIDRVADNAKFNEKKLLDGSLTGCDIQVDTEASSTKISIAITTLNTTGLSINGLKATSVAEATSLNSKVKTAIETLSTKRADLGAIQNRLEHTVNNLDNVVENTTAAESRIRDTDMASEMVKFSNSNVLAQAGTAMLAQANQSGQNVLSILQ